MKTDKYRKVKLHRGKGRLINSADTISLNFVVTDMVRAITCDLNELRSRLKQPLVVTDAGQDNSQRPIRSLSLMPTNQNLSVRLRQQPKVAQGDLSFKLVDLVPLRPSKAAC